MLTSSHFIFSSRAVAFFFRVAVPQTSLRAFYHLSLIDIHACGTCGSLCLSAVVFRSVRAHMCGSAREKQQENDKN